MANPAPDRPVWFHLNHEDAVNEKGQLIFHELPSLYPCFFVPALQDKPQNPIIDNLKLSEKNEEPKKDLLRVRPSLPQKLKVATDDLLRSQEETQQSKEILNWSTLDLHGNHRKLLSWDALRPANQPICSSAPFLSERNGLVYASARYHVYPRLKDASTHIVYVTQRDLFSSLGMTALGNSSLYHTWDVETERFIQLGVKAGERGFLLLDGMDEVISNSVIARFLTIGNMMRRLDIFAAGLRSWSVKSTPTLHAFAHALSKTLDYLRNALTQCSPSSGLQTGNIPISSVWIRYEIYRDVLFSLAELCGCTEDKTPSQYEPFDADPINLLSRIYEHLDTHITQQSPKAITAILAHILTCSSREYLYHIAQSVGFGYQPLQKKQERIVNLPLDEYALEDAQDDEEDIFDILERLEDAFPSFFPPDLLRILPAAQRSLILLKRADPDHPLLNQPAGQSEVLWFWKKEEIEAAWLENQVFHTRHTEVRRPDDFLGAYSTFDYKPELAGLRIFDMEPGTSIGDSLGTYANTTQVIQDFIDSFPNTLPAITPTLAHLSSLVFSGLLRHASSLSSALLNLFLGHPGRLNLRSHLTLLRDFLLLTASPFKSRLSAALFSDREDYEIDDKNRTPSLQILRPRKQVTESTQPWAVGLASTLLEREIWPPVGADLSFFLRTVIVDSLEYPQDNYKMPKEVVTDASWRLGFAIRDLPVGPGRDRWLSPLCVEALDFLYMDYKPPHPLEVLVPYEVLSKYQRMFTFLLRLLRVDHALLAVHRMTRSPTHPIFPTLVSARKLTLHFRFVAQSFVSALSGYVFDTVIGGNFNPFLTQLASGRESDDMSEHLMFSDVFELAKRHSALLDDILSACLMRSGQRATGDLLRQATEIVLEFSVVIGELRRERLQEYEAAPMVEDLYAKFKGKMTTLTQVLKGLVEKSSSKLAADQFLAGQHNLPGEAEALHHLLLRIDISNWWSTSPQ